MGFNVVLEALYMSGPIAGFVFFVLVLMSVVSWGLIIATAVYFKRLAAEDIAFLELFSQKGTPTELYISQGSQENSDLKVVGVRAIFSEIYHEVVKLEKQVTGLNFNDPRMQMIKTNFDEMIQRTLVKVKNRENNKRERFFAFFATTSNTAPFIGLLGTVIGIIDAFSIIGKMGSADLGFVAPAISEALVATALGLFVAIPASIAFNYFRAQSFKFRETFDQFTMDLLNQIQQQYFLKNLSGTDHFEPQVESSGLEI